jgi:hypothetical protein
MSPTYLTGTTHDLEESPENIVLYLIRDRWPLVQDGYIPNKESITFSLFGWSGRKSYQISVEPSNAPVLQRLSFGSDNVYVQYNDPILIHVWIIKNRDEVPPQLHHITQKVEQIIFENQTNVGYGITAARLMAPFSAVEQTTGFFGSTNRFGNMTEVSLWHSTAIVELFYFKVTTGTLSGARVSKTHKYDIEVE